MNRFFTRNAANREATLRFLPGEFHVVSAGDSVKCAVTGVSIPLDELRYWSVERQEAYVDADVSVRAHRDAGDVPE